MGSGNLAMKFAPLYVLLWAAPNLVAAQSEVICPEGKSSTKKSLGLDEYVDYKTQDGAPGTDYTNGVNCNVLFREKKGSDCELKFNCTHFDLKSAKPAPKCQDKIIISKKKYCQTTGPDVTVSGSKLKVAFKTNKKGTATGAVCTAYCVPPPPPPGNTTVSPPTIPELVVKLTVAVDIKNEFDTEIDVDMYCPKHVFMTPIQTKQSRSFDVCHGV